MDNATIIAMEALFFAVNEAYAAYDDGRTPDVDVDGLHAACEEMTSNIERCARERRTAALAHAAGLARAEVES